MLHPGNRIAVCPLLFVALALFALPSCNSGDKPKLPKPPFEIPINLLREGVIADFNIRVTKHDVYSFDMLFGYPREDQAERERVRKLVGEYGRDKDNNLIEPGILTPVRLTIFKKQAKGESIIYQITIEDPETYAFSSSNFFKNIGHCNLPRGKYRFVLESLAQPQEYASIPTLFHIGTDPKSFFIPINIDRSMSCPQ